MSAREDVNQYPLQRVHAAHAKMREAHEAAGQHVTEHAAEHFAAILAQQVNAIAQADAQGPQTQTGQTR